MASGVDGAAPRGTASLSGSTFQGHSRSGGLSASVFLRCSSLKKEALAIDPQAMSEIVQAQNPPPSSSPSNLFSCAVRPSWGAERHAEQVREAHST
jgi:hypothetical protein